MHESIILFKYVHHKTFKKYHPYTLAKHCLFT